MLLDANQIIRDVRDATSMMPQSVKNFQPMRKIQEANDLHQVLLSTDDGGAGSEDNTARNLVGHASLDIMKRLKRDRVDKASTQLFKRSDESEERRDSLNAPTNT
jgi:hypothetical protein